MREVRTTSGMDAEVRVPGSKSMTNRGLVIGALAEGETVLEGPQFSDDTRAMVRALEVLGFSVRVDEPGDRMTVQGRGGAVQAPGGRVRVGESGTALRFLTALAALSSGGFEIGGDAGLRRRPVEPLCAALRRLGADVRPAEGGGPPVEVRAGASGGGAARVSGEVSSQFASALLLIGPYLEGGLDLEVRGRIVSEPYLELTLEMMRESGVGAERSGEGRYRVEPGVYRGTTHPIEGDATSASYFLAAAAVTGGRVRVENLALTSRQGDVEIVDVLEAMGCEVVRTAGTPEVRGGSLVGVDVDLGRTPDLVPTVAAVAMTARGVTRIRGAAHIRVKESDRIDATLAAVRSLGGRAWALPDGVAVEGGGLRAGVVDPRNDHRIAMAFAVLGLVQEGIRIRDPECVSKSFPGFFELLAKL